MKKRTRNPLTFIVQADSFTEFRFLPAAEKAAREGVAKVGQASEADEAMSGNVFDGADFGESKHDFAFAALAAWDCLREIGLSPAWKNRKLLAAETPDHGEKMVNCLRLIAAIDNDQFGRRREVFVPRAVKRYAQAYFAALAAVKPIRKVEQAFYKLYGCQYEIHFDLLVREVIISKKAPEGFMGWLLRRSSRGYCPGGYRNHDDLVRIGTVVFKEERP